MNNTIKYVIAVAILVGGNICFSFIMNQLTDDVPAIRLSCLMFGAMLGMMFAIWHYGNTKNRR